MDGKRRRQQQQQWMVGLSSTTTSSSRATEKRPNATQRMVRASRPCRRVLARLPPPGLSPIIKKRKGSETTTPTGTAPAPNRLSIKEPRCPQRAPQGFNGTAGAPRPPARSPHIVIIGWATPHPPLARCRFPRPFTQPPPNRPHPTPFWLPVACWSHSIPGRPVCCGGGGQKKRRRGGPWWVSGRANNEQGRGPLLPATESTHGARVTDRECTRATRLPSCGSMCLGSIETEPKAALDATERVRPARWRERRASK